MTDKEIAQKYSLKRALIIEDFAEFRSNMKTMLQNFGILDIDAVENGERALQKLALKHYELVLCDHNLGSGKNGQQVLEEAKHRDIIRYTTVFIIVTAETKRQEVMATIENQPSGYIIKPYTHIEFKQRLDRLLAQHDHLHKIHQTMDTKNYSRAIELCDQKIKGKSPLSFTCLKLKTELLYLLGNYAEAKVILNKLLEDRYLDWAKLGIGKIQFQEEEYPEAIETFNDILEHNEFCMIAQDWLYQTYDHLNQIYDAKKALEGALKASPKSFSRQKNYAELCTLTSNHNDACKAYTSALTISTNSRFESLDNKINLAKSLVSYSNDTYDYKNSTQKKAQDMLKEINDEKNITPRQTMLTNLVEGTLAHYQDKKEDTNRAIASATRIFDEFTDETNDILNPELTLAFSETLIHTDNEEKAIGLLTTLAKQTKDNPKVQSHIDRMVDTPITEEGKQQVSSINTDGIKAFKSKNYTEAGKTFTEALQHYPKNITLHLNLIQTLQAEMKHKKNNSAHIERCQQSFSIVEGLPETHMEYKRYQKLLTSLKEIESSNENESD